MRDLKFLLPCWAITKSLALCAAGPGGIQVLAKTSRQEWKAEILKEIWEGLSEKCQNWEQVGRPRWEASALKGHHHLVHLGEDDRFPPTAQTSLALSRKGTQVDPVNKQDPRSTADRILKGLCSIVSRCRLHSALGSLQRIHVRSLDFIFSWCWAHFLVYPISLSPLPCCLLIPFDFDFEGFHPDNRRPGLDCHVDR